MNPRKEPTTAVRADLKAINRITAEAMERGIKVAEIATAALRVWIALPREERDKLLRR